MEQRRAHQHLGQGGGRGNQDDSECGRGMHTGTG